MKNVLFLSLGLFALTACNNGQKNSSSENVEEQKETELSIGGTKDEHGCLVASGESWSEIKQSCVQIFDVAQRLSPITIKDGEAEISAFILFNDDKSKVELFLPGDQGTNILLDKSEENVYQNNTYKYDSKESALYINGEKKYGV
ncbi:MAG: hypothetical protein LBI72_02230 [Flavobacteriaceae bacterium]|jgi:hypothetical protein|nr:hypothetical protein [Flavobacteriaceae bacterium]